jgi:hypothetical protein
MGGDHTRTTAEKLRLFRRLFAGLPRVYGTYDPHTGRVRQIKEPVTDRVLLAHLQGRRSYGVYLLVGDRTRAIAVDFDTDDLLGPVEFVNAARGYHIASYIERSKSKGYHVWIFFGKRSVPAAKARLVVRHILAEIERPTTEVFPKQDSLDTNVTYGNFINAPLFGALVSKGRTIFVDPADPTKPCWMRSSKSMNSRCRLGRLCRTGPVPTTADAPTACRLALRECWPKVSRRINV